MKDTTSKVAQFNFFKNEENTYFLAWTTTPWTLPRIQRALCWANYRLCKVKTQNPYTKEICNLILAENLLGAVMGKTNMKFSIAKRFRISGIAYEQLIPWVNPGEGAFKVITGDFVTTEDGTGIVHCTSLWCGR